MTDKYRWIPSKDKTVQRIKLAEESQLDRLSDERIFAVDQSKGETHCTFWEQCDDHFNCKLNKAEMVKLIDELEQIAIQMVDPS